MRSVTLSFVLGLITFILYMVLLTIAVLILYYLAQYVNEMGAERLLSRLWCGSRGC